MLLSKQGFYRSKRGGGLFGGKNVNVVFQFEKPPGAYSEEYGIQSSMSVEHSHPSDTTSESSKGSYPFVNELVV